MRFTLLRPAIKEKPDLRPLYRRILTNKRQDFVHRSSVLFLVGGAAFLVGVMFTKVFIYVNYEYSVIKEQREALHKEIVDAEISGFQLKN